MSRHETFVIYFGCWDEAGHYLWKPWKHKVWDRDVRQLHIPTAGDLDGSKLFLPHPEKKGTGTLTYLPAPNISILAWWGNPWDGRGAVNSAIITNGETGGTELWQRFVEHFPDLSAELALPQL